MSQGLHISHAHAVTAAGSGIAAALGAVHTGLNSTTRHPALTLPDSQGAQQPVSYAPALSNGFEGAREPALLQALCDSLAEDGTSNEAGTEPAWLMVPGDHAPYDHEQDADALAGLLDQASGLSVHAVAADSGGTPVLAQLREHLSDHGGTSAWLVGVASGVTSERIDDLTRHWPVQRRRMPGLIPGEAAAAVRVERTADAPQGPSIQGLASADEPASEPTRETMNGLSSAISNALAEAGLAANRVATHLSDDLGDHNADREWWQCVQRLWPTRLPEDQRRAMELGLLKETNIESPEPKRRRPPGVLGHVGAASLPLQLGLAARQWAWQQRWQAFRLDPGPAPMLVTEHPGARRHAVVIGS
jgi:hypothetical protein